MGMWLLSSQTHSVVKWSLLSLSHWWNWKSGNYNLTYTETKSIVFLPLSCLQTLSNQHAFTYSFLYRSRGKLVPCHIYGLCASDSELWQHQPDKAGSITSQAKTPSCSAVLPFLCLHSFYLSPLNSHSMGSLEKTKLTRADFLQCTSTVPVKENWENDKWKCKEMK